MRKPQQILEDCRGIMPFELKKCFDPYMIECMEIYAKEYHKSKVESGLLHSVSESFNSDLRNRFFKECTDPSPDSGKNAGVRKVNLTAHNLFEWFKSNVR